ncbi:VTT domain-containing protein [Paracoccaceae bacterium Fryx2]|nr:VTT domain-containing protein [Paracoccaceae bacterium Fryx2]
MIGLESAIALLATQGLPLLAPIAVLEGPIITVIAGYLASLSHIPLVPAFVVLVIADLVGDSLLYGVGRKWGGALPGRLRRLVDADGTRLAQLAAHFGRHGGRTLILGKLTHSAGAAILVAAGIARMPFLPFLWFNLLATIPKTLAFLAIGYGAGHAFAEIDRWISWGSLAVVLLIGLVVLLRLRLRRGVAR